MTQSNEEGVNNMNLEIGKAYKLIGQKFPFNKPYGIYVGESAGGFQCFTHGTAHLAINGGEYEEILIDTNFIDSGVTLNGEKLFKRIKP